MFHILVVYVDFKMKHLIIISYIVLVLLLWGRFCFPPLHSTLMTLGDTCLTHKRLIYFVWVITVEFPRKYCYFLPSADIYINVKSFLMILHFVFVMLLMYNYFLVYVVILFDYSTLLNVTVNFVNNDFMAWAPSMSVSFLGQMQFALQLNMFTP